MKTINLSLSKRLNDEWYLEGVETEYFYRYCSYNKIYEITKCGWEKEIRDRYLNYWFRWDDIKTLTANEIDKFIYRFKNEKIKKYIIWKYQWIKYDLEKMDIEFYTEMLEYLLNNNLLWKQAIT